MTGRAPVCVLVGPPGAGKTTVGGLVAQTLAVPFHDTDAAIAESAGRSIAEIFLADGEGAFRELERAEVARALAQERGVVALGGGAVMDPVTQGLLADHMVVFLDVTIAQAAPRVGFDQSRPLLAVNPRARWTELMAARRPVYEALAQVRVDTAGRTPEEVAALIVEWLASARPDD